MENAYDPRHYWERRLNSRFSLRGVGHLSFSESYNNWLYRRKERCIESCLSGVDLTDKNVLDIGCGTGFFVDWYLRKGAHVCGVDITNVSIAQLKQKYQGDFYTQDITDPNFSLPANASLPSGGFDIVNMWDVVYHIVDPRRFEQAFDNIARSIKPGGLLLFTDWLGASSDARRAPHVQSRCLDTYNRMLPAKGFELLGVHALYNHLNKMHLRLGSVNLPILDNSLGRLYFILDNRSNKIPADNLSLGVWRCTQPSRASTEL